MPERVGYARVSTVDQSTAAQEDALERAGCTRIVVETASGADASRPRLAELLDALGPGDVLICWKLDRLARSSFHLATIAGHLAERGADLVCLTQPIDTTTPAGRMLFTILGAVAELERDLIGERTRAGMAAARRRGRQIGRPSIDPRALETVREQLRRGASISQAAREAGISRAVVYKHIPASEREALRASSDA